MIRQLHVTQLIDELQEKDISLEHANIWDVRDNSAYIDGHIRGAVNHPVNQGINKDALDKTTGSVYVLCGGGSKAPRAAGLLESLDQNRDIVVLTAGTRGAKAANMDLVTGNDRF